MVYTDGQGHGQIIALKSIGSYIWGEKGVDISTITNAQNAQTASYELTSCINTAKIIAAAKGNKSKYPAAWAANEYKTEGTNAGDWCLPAAGIFTSYFKNQKIINTGLTNAGGTPFTNTLNAWTSTEMNSDYAWISYLFMEYGLQSKGKNYSNEVRPVLEF